MPARTIELVDSLLEAVLPVAWFFRGLVGFTAEKILEDENFDPNDLAQYETAGFEVGGVLRRWKYSGMDIATGILHGIMSQRPVPLNPNPTNEGP